MSPLTMSGQKTEYLLDAAETLTSKMEQSVYNWLKQTNSQDTNLGFAVQDITATLAASTLLLARLTVAIEENKK